MRPDAASAGIVREIGPGAVARTVLRAARAPVRRRRSPSPARSRCSARARAWPPSPRSPRSTRRRSPRAAGVLARAEILRAEPPLGFVHALVRDAVYREMPHGERALWHDARGRACCSALGALAEPGRRAAAQRAAARATTRSPSSSTTPAAPRSRAARPTARSACSQRALDEPPAPERRAAILLDLGLAETLVDGARGRRAPARGLRGASTDPVARARMAVMLTQVLTFTTAPEEALRGRARARSPSSPPELRDVRRRLEAQLAVAIQWGAGPARTSSTRSSRNRAGSTSRAPARACSRRWSRCTSPTTRAPVDGLRRADRARVGRRHAAGGGRGPVHRRGAAGARPWPTATRRSTSPSGWSSGRTGAARSSACSPSSLWRGWMHLRRGELVDAVDSLRTALDELDAWHGAAGGDVYAAAHYAQTLLERGDLEGAWRDARRRGCATRCGRRSRRRAGGTASSASCCSRRGRAEEALALSERMRTDNPHVENPTRDHVALAAGARAAPARPHRGGARARRRQPRDRAPLRRPVDGRPRAARARRAAGRGRARRARASRSRCSRARPRGSSSPSRSPPTAARCATRAGRPTRASRCAARSSWPTRAAPPAWPRRCAPSSTPRARGRAPPR